MKTNNRNSNIVISMKKKLAMYFIASLFLMFEMAVQVSPSVMTSQFMHDFQISTFGLGIMSGCYFYSYTAMQIPSGILFDRYNPRIVMVGSIMICNVGCLLLAWSTNIGFASIARLLMGSGSAFAFVSVLVVIADVFPSRLFATMTGVTQMLAALGAIAGQLPVHVLVSYLGWRSTMYLFAFTGTIIAILVFYFLRYNKTFEKNTRLNQARLCEKLIIVIKKRQTWYVSVYACALWAPMSAFSSLWGVPFLSKVNHLSENQASFICSLMWVGLAIASPLVCYLSTRFNCRRLFLAYLSAFGLIVFTIVLFFHVSNIECAILLFLVGATCSGQALSFTVVKELSPNYLVATAIAFNNMAVVLSGAIFQPLIGWLLSRHGSDSIMNYRHAFTVILIAYLGGYLVSLFLIEETAQSTSTDLKDIISDCL